MDQDVPDFREVTQYIPPREAAQIETGDLRQVCLGTLNCAPRHLVVLEGENAPFSHIACQFGESVFHNAVKIDQEGESKDSRDVEVELRLEIRDLGGEVGVVPAFRFCLGFERGIGSFSRVGKRSVKVLHVALRYGEVREKENSE